MLVKTGLQRLIAVILLFLNMNASSAQALPADTTNPVYSYFRLNPMQRLEMMDSLITKRGSSIAISFIDDDLQALLGDTVSVMQYCNSPGVQIAISDADDEKVAALKKSRQRKIERKKFDKRDTEFPGVSFASDSTHDDSLTSFLVVYLKLPVQARIDCFVNHFSPLPVWILSLVATDLNAITGCNFTVGVIYKNKPALDMTAAEMSEVCWSEWLKQ